MTQNPQVQSQLQGYIAAVSQHPPSAERLQLIQRLDTSSGGTTLLADTIQVTMRTMMALEGRQAAANSPGAQIPKTVLDSLHNMVVTTLLFTYRDVSDQELGQYADIWERPALRNFTASFSQAFIGTLQLQMVEFWNDFVQPVSTAGRSKPGASPRRTSASGRKSSAR